MVISLGKYGDHSKGNGDVSRENIVIIVGEIVIEEGKI